MASVMVVEDEGDFRAALCETLTYAGFATVDAETADLAAELLRQDHDIVLLLTDIDLPGQLDGVALAYVARQRHPRMPIVFISGRPMKLREAWPLDGPAAFFHKPFGFNLLITAVKGFLHQTVETLGVPPRLLP